MKNEFDYKAIAKLLCDYEYDIIFQGRKLIIQPLPEAVFDIIGRTHDQINRYNEGYYDIIAEEDRRLFDIEKSNLYNDASITLEYSIINGSFEKVKIKDVLVPKKNENSQVIGYKGFVKILRNDSEEIQTIQNLTEKSKILADYTEGSFLLIDMASSEQLYKIKEFKFKNNLKYFNNYDEVSLISIFGSKYEELTQIIDAVYLKGKIQKIDLHTSWGLMNINVIKFESRFVYLFLNLEKDSSALSSEMFLLINDYADKTSNIFCLFKMQEKIKLLKISNSLQNYGYSSDDFRSGNSDIEDLYYWDDRLIWSPKFSLNFFENNTLFTAEYRIMNKTGALSYVRDFSYIVKTRSDEYMVSWHRDISDIKKMEQQYKDNKLFLDATINTIPVGLVMLRKNRIFWTNKTFDKIVEYKRTELTDSTLDFLFKDGKMAHKKEMELYHTIYNRINSPVIADWTTKSGKTITVHIHTATISNEFYLDDIMLTIHNITELYNSQKNLEESKKNLAELTRHLDTIREDQIKEISKLVHDELGQPLTSIKIDLIWLKDDVSENIGLQIDDIIKNIDSTINTIRQLSVDLRPPILDYVGLEGAIEWAAEEFEKRNKIKVNLNIEAIGADMLDISKILIYRIYQEALTNIIRHADASEIFISLHILNEYLILSIEDNGTGIDNIKVSNFSSFGISAIRERANALNADFEIGNRMQGGTFVKLIVPLYKNV